MDANQTLTLTPARGAKRLRASFHNWRGIALALEMLSDLEEETGGEGYILADACQLDTEYDGGMPFRNIVQEKLDAARQLGPEVAEGFCVVLSHVVAVNALGFGVCASEVEAVIRTAVVKGGDA